jgi:hypothetical protein
MKFVVKINVLPLRADDEAEALVLELARRLEANKGVEVMSIKRVK